MLANLLQIMSLSIMSHLTSPYYDNGNVNQQNSDVNFFLRLLQTYTINFFLRLLLTTLTALHSNWLYWQEPPGPSRAGSGPGAINSTGPCVGVAAHGQEGAMTNANQFKPLIKHCYSKMQSSNCSMLMQNSHGPPWGPGPGVLPRLLPSRRYWEQHITWTHTHITLTIDLPLYKEMTTAIMDKLNLGLCDIHES